jgi:hypothetical protein
VTRQVDWFEVQPSGVRPAERVRVQDHAGRWGTVVWFLTDPVGALVSWDEGHATRLTGRRFAELTAFAATQAA